MDERPVDTYSDAERADELDRFLAALGDLVEEHAHRDLQLRQGLCAIDREVTAYRRKLVGLDPWTDFAALVPASVREALEKAV